MPIIATDEWLLAHYEERDVIFQKLQEYVSVPIRPLSRYLTSRGMYRPVQGGIAEVKRLQERSVWQEIERELHQLRRWLSGPDIPIFIFPSDVHNRQMQQEYDGRSGLAFGNCLFLFVSSRNSLEQMKALLVHEYHHICRLQALKKEELQYTLLDTMIMEGLAEAAVAERYGEAYYAPWTRYYKQEKAVQLFQRYLKQQLDVYVGTREHEALLHGLGTYPSMLGYAVGFHLVQDCIKQTKLTTKQLLTMDAKAILEKASSF